LTSNYVFRPLDAGAEQELARLDSPSPFCTVAYARSLRRIGNEVWVFGPDRDGMLEDATLGCISPARWSRTLYFPSLAAFAGDPLFWESVYAMARQNGIDDVSAGTFGSPAFDLPRLRGETYRHTRQEYVLDLREPDLRKLMRHGFRDNVRKAQNAGLELRRGREAQFLEAHLEMMRASRHRRAERGETISDAGEANEARVYLAEGAGELFQALKDGEVVSSALLLRSGKQAYTQTSGSQPQGMRMGAAHFLIFQAAQILQSEGAECLNHGGAPEGSTLAEFKSRFSSTIVTLPAAACYLGPVWKRKTRTLAGLIRHRPDDLKRIIKGSRTRWLVYGLDLATTPEPVVVPGAEFSPLPEEQLMRLKNPPGYPHFRQDQVQRLRRLGGSCAFGVFVNGELAHIRWFLTQEHNLKESPRILELQPDEGEITASETFPEYRGRGLSPFAIQQVAALARERGIRRIYGKTKQDNLASQRSMTKAGFKPVGHVDVIQPPLRPGAYVVKRHIRWD
jgi:RimJ/RimL family protein N-acetyltransferase